MSLSLPGLVFLTLKAIIAVGVSITFLKKAFCSVLVYDQKEGPT